MWALIRYCSNFYDYACCSHNWIWLSGPLCLAGYQSLLPSHPVCHITSGVAWSPWILRPPHVERVWQQHWRRMVSCKEDSYKFQYYSVHIILVFSCNQTAITTYLPLVSFHLLMYPRPSPFPGWLPYISLILLLFLKFSIFLLTWVVYRCSNEPVIPLTSQAYWEIQETLQRVPHS